MIDVTSGLWILFASIIVVFCVAPSKLEFKYRAMLMGFLLLTGALSYRSINSRSGHPTAIPSFNKEEVEVLGFYVNPEDDRLYLWLKLEGSEFPQSFAMAGNEEIIKRLKALRKQHKGKPFLMSISTQKNNNSNRLLDQSDSSIKVEVEGHGFLPQKTQN